jgi:hypothetical protein
MDKREPEPIFVGEAFAFVFWLPKGHCRVASAGRGTATGRKNRETYTLRHLRR